MSIIVGVLFYVNMGTECGNYRGLCLTVSDYSENSTVHGVKYITDKVTFINEKTYSIEKLRFYNLVGMLPEEHAL